MLVAFIIELLIITASLGARHGRNAIAGVHGYIQRLFNRHDLFCGGKTLGANS